MRKKNSPKTHHIFSSLFDTKTPAKVGFHDQTRNNDVWQYVSNKWHKIKAIHNCYLSIRQHVILSSAVITTPCHHKVWSKPYSSQFLSSRVQKDFSTTAAKEPMACYCNTAMLARVLYNTASCTGWRIPLHPDACYPKHMLRTPGRINRNKTTESVAWTTLPKQESKTHRNNSVGIESLDK